ncbi:UNKNOWN [Stylonychia lemnae]|uniref:Uncharacterized protein n=1 Tax=Stylonychia lemnae TaxID=5949 RepID=A0A078A1P1_STYLE|nr:UNKNOWN [Stylonychia lemnae]|eukprot:CDW75378.1 UNKNOWN [Stylonychia lemnae]
MVHGKFAESLKKKNSQNPIAQTNIKFTDKNLQKTSSFRCDGQKESFLKRSNQMDLEGYVNKSSSKKGSEYGNNSNHSQSDTKNKFKKNQELDFSISSDEYKDQIQDEIKLNSENLDQLVNISNSNKSKSKFFEQRNLKLIKNHSYQGESEKINFSISNNCNAVSQLNLQYQASSDKNQQDQAKLENLQDIFENPAFQKERITRVQSNGLPVIKDRHHSYNGSPLHQLNSKAIIQHDSFKNSTTNFNSQTNANSLNSSSGLMINKTSNQQNLSQLNVSQFMMNFSKKNLQKSITSSDKLLAPSPQKLKQSFLNQKMHQSGGQEQIQASLNQTKNFFHNRKMSYENQFYFTNKLESKRISGNGNYGIKFMNNNQS